jgi:hypothetical protein
MRPRQRIVVAAALSAAVSTGLLATDWCGDSCRLAQSAVAAAACHHTTSAAARVGRDAGRCRHDHRAAPITAAGAVVTLRGRSLETTYAIVGAAGGVGFIPPPWRHRPDLGPPIVSVARSVAAPLRI